MYNTTLLGLVNVVMHLLVSDNAVATLCVRIFSAVGGTVFTVSVVFGPKVYKVRTKHACMRYSLVVYIRSVLV